mmetsp:Transcript_2398/g.5086  ORF Transcript_2398/g.5086 Transcript_2398/m.5086 type:complete len:148 (-) Transcript_2398:70-513(-)|eukprot:CAMPEP_0170284068 /NCGR_PEP_ID=MMETSP0116_2-20130129/42071_1 /TAXON_ID=400756 /ORGANISM="Durinskia baltica, Strain CSIRO CS-38" /LENGTH=147 /DNA_ID=CAMNT_0010535445 /DNA_START=75 /DNA_END=518 /DNA_ORIENTATION=-
MARGAFKLLAVFGAIQLAAGSVQDLGGGLTLEMTKQGDGVHFPKAGDRLTMHYTGTLAKGGSKFDSSRDRGQPFEFKIGEGEVITGWDNGVIKMSLGERAMLHVPSDMGYGAGGAPPVIPPNADLNFDVELLAINGQTTLKQHNLEG